MMGYRFAPPILRAAMDHLSRLWSQFLRWSGELRQPPYRSSSKFRTTQKGMEGMKGVQTSDQFPRRCQDKYSELEKTFGLKAQRRERASNKKTSGFEQ